MKTARFVFNFDSAEEARIVAESLDPEIKHKIPKTNVKVFLSKKTFSIEIEAKEILRLKDLSAKILSKSTGQKKDKIINDFDRDYNMTAKEI